MKKYFFKVTVSVLLMTSLSALAAVTPVGVDNSARNTRDRAGKFPTAQDQVKGSPHDVDITRAARQSLVKDQTLSMNAKNIKIITIRRVVTLRGPVNSLAEKEKVLSHVKDTASNIQIVDNLEIIKK